MTIEQPGSRERYRKLHLPGGKAEVWLEPAGSKVTMHTIRPNGGGSSSWPRCDIPGCLGEAVVSRSKCLAHTDGNSRMEYLVAADVSRVLSLRGVAISPELLKAILDSPTFSLRNANVPMSFAGADMTGNSV